MAHELSHRIQPNLPVKDRAVLHLGLKGIPVTLVCSWTANFLTLGTYKKRYCKDH